MTRIFEVFRELDEHYPAFSISSKGGLVALKVRNYDKTVLRRGLHYLPSNSKYVSNLEIFRTSKEILLSLERDFKDRVERSNWYKNRGR